MKTILLILLLSSLSSFACRVPIATTTVYYTPNAKKICGRYNFKCQKFKDEVEMQGSGKLAPDKIYRYTGETEQRQSSCETTTGAAGICLIPYISVAADKRYFNMGDIISMPAMKGQKIRAPDGSELIHPGYFVVHDTGGAIDGRGRFDFYTGPMGLSDKNNSFGYSGSTSKTTMFSEESCDERKKFDRVSPKAKNFAAVRALIEKFDKVMLAKSKVAVDTMIQKVADKKPEEVSSWKKFYNIVKKIKNKVTN